MPESLFAGCGKQPLSNHEATLIHENVIGSNKSGLRFQSFQH